MINRYFKIYAGSNYILSIIKMIKDEPGVTYVFEPEKYADYHDPDEKTGFYEFIIDIEKYKGKVSLDNLADYEMVTVSKGTYEHLLDKDAKRPYKDLYSKYSKTIQPVIDNAIAEAIKKERERILNENFSEEYKTEIIKGSQNMYNALKERFSAEECNIGELCDLYKKEIDAILHLKIGEMVEYINKTYKLTPIHIPEWGIRPKSTINPFILNNDNKISINGEELSIKSLDDIWKLSKYIGKVKNDIVDNIVKLYGTARGREEYYRVMRYAGKIADEIECTMMNLYAPHYID